MTEQLQVGERMKVLEVGTGSGYQAAVLARLCRRVYTIERYRTLLKDALKRLRSSTSTTSRPVATARRAGLSRRRSTESS